ncbi:protein tonB2-like [Battus philenor]|uniref:protein tonB2-like n=1 Tax=Battus philenor TaxID=42288 RepID=UPI0035CF28CA
MSHVPPPGGPPPYPPPAPGAFAYVPAPVMMPMYPYPPPELQPQPTYVTNYIYPPPVPAPPEPVHVVENSGPIIDWVPTTPTNASSLTGRAVVAGKEGWDSSPLWIIRAHHNGDLIPGKLAVQHRSAYIPYAGKEVPVHNFEVLCAPSHAVRWVPANNGSVPPTAIAAGNTHTAEPLYIGRVTHMRSVTPGKIHPTHGCCYISFSGGEVSYKYYEVLCETNI